MTQKSPQALAPAGFLKVSVWFFAISIQTDSPAHSSRDDDGDGDGGESSFC
jgi:hypothetical protein